MIPAVQSLITLTQLQERLTRLRERQLSAQEFSAWVPAQPGLLAALPEKYGLVLQDLLNRLEAGALFDEESCSFSQDEIHDALQLWIDKAGSALQKLADCEASDQATRSAG